MSSVETILRHLEDGRVTRREAVVALVKLLTPENVGEMMTTLPPDVASDLERWAATIPENGGVVIGANLSREHGQRTADHLQVAAARVRAWLAEQPRQPIPNRDGYSRDSGAGPRRTDSAKDICRDIGSSTSSIGDELRAIVAPLYLTPDFAPSWAGPGPEPDTFCIGSEDGRVLFTTPEGEPLGGAERTSTGTEQAINGVAFLANRMAVTTRQEVIVLKQADQEDTRPRRAVFPAMAQGVIATRRGYFMAPAGPEGLLLVEPKSGPQISITVSRPTEALTFSKLTVLSDGVGRDILVCAMRSGGIGVTSLSTGAHVGSLSLLTFTGADVVDVCALAPDSDPLAAAAVDRNCTLLLFRDVLRDRRPLPLKFDGIEGTASRVLSCRGSLFLITTARVYFLPGFAAQFLEGNLANAQPTPAGSLVLDAKEANLVTDRWLLLVTRRQVHRVNVPLLANKSEASGLHKESLQGSPVAPDWQERKTEMSEVGA